MMNNRTFVSHFSTKNLLKRFLAVVLLAGLSGCCDDHFGSARYDLREHWAPHGWGFPRSRFADDVAPSGISTPGAYFSDGVDHAYPSTEIAQLKEIRQNSVGRVALVYEDTPSNLSNSSPNQPHLHVFEVDMKVLNPAIDQAWSNEITSNKIGNSDIWLDNTVAGKIVRINAQGIAGQWYPALDAPGICESDAPTTLAAWFGPGVTVSPAVHPWDGGLTWNGPNGERSLAFYNTEVDEPNPIAATIAPVAFGADLATAPLQITPLLAPARD